MSAPATTPAIDGWFTHDPEPRLIGRHCRRCGTYAFPPTVRWCPNPDCDNDEMEPAELSRRARVWSYTDARYQPPPPFVPQTDPYEPFAIVAAELEVEKIIVLGQAASGVATADLSVGATVELVVEPLYRVDGVDHLVWRWRPVAEVVR
ncbi:MAG TPA: zinc ribbon domain-containing protein [Acidimicrobiales bacterium]|nr:zinc ribbon domain-containing protein [Acidimicrobiales bacterium]